MATSKELRMQKRASKLGIDAHCQICGEEDITKLVEAKGSLLEEHHIPGGHEGETIIVCRNCHARLTDDQLDYSEGVIADNRTEEMKSVAFFLGLASILFLLAVYCIKNATTLYNFVNQVQGVSA